MMVLRVNLEMLGEIVDALAQERHLDFRRSGIAVVRPVCPDDPGLAVLVKRHAGSSTNGPEVIRGRESTGPPYCQLTMGPQKTHILYQYDRWVQRVRSLAFGPQGHKGAAG